MTKDKFWKLNMESFGKLCWLVLWTDQVLMELDNFEILNVDDKICSLVLSGQF